MRPWTPQVVVGTGPVASGRRRPRRPRTGDGVRLADDALAEIARSRDVVDAAGQGRPAALRHLHRLRRAGHHAHPARAARPAAAQPDPLARRRVRARGRARGRARADAAAAVDAGHRAHRRAAWGPRRPTPRCSTPGSPRSCTSTARSAAPATSRRCRTVALALMGEGEVRDADGDAAAGRRGAARRTASSRSSSPRRRAWR